MIRSRLASDGTVHVELYGHWDMRTLRTRAEELLAQLTLRASQPAQWDLTRIDDLDIGGATLLWRVWQRRRPAKLALRPEDEPIFTQLERLPERDRTRNRRDPAWPLLSLGRLAQSFVTDALGMLQLLGDVALWSARLIAKPAAIPFRELSATIYRSGLQALPITALVGFLIGIVLSYLSGDELRSLGADVLIVNLMGISILRELGPLLAAILNAGRSGSAMTAQIGVMRVTGELEAMSVLGISHTLRLVLPRLLGQLIALPLVVLWTDVLAIIGGMLGAKLQLGVSYRTFIHRLPQVVPVVDLWFGVAKGAVFGALVAVVACYFGLRLRPDTEGLAAGTTLSVVTALTLVLLADALFAIVFVHTGQ